MKKQKKRQAHEHLPGMRNMQCPYCRSPVEVRSAKGIYRYDTEDTRLLVCSRYPECDSYVKLHPGTDRPMGSLANKELRRLRRVAHQQFNQIYQKGLMSKNDAYGWLAGILDVPRAQAHIGYLGDYYCQTVISESSKLLARRGILPAPGRRQPRPYHQGGERIA